MVADMNHMFTEFVVNFPITFSCNNYNPCGLDVHVQLVHVYVCTFNLCIYVHVC